MVDTKIVDPEYMETPVDIECATMEVVDRSLADVHEDGRDVYVVLLDS